MGIYLKKKKKQNPNNSTIQFHIIERFHKQILCAILKFSLVGLLTFYFFIRFHLNGFEFAHWHAQLSFAKKDEEEEEKYLRSNAPVVLGTMRIEGEAEMGQKSDKRGGELFLGMKLRCTAQPHIY